jgi:hypothetical protein
VKIHQVNRATRPFCQLGHQSQLLSGCEAVTGVYRQVQIAVCPLSAGGQRAKQNGQSDPRLCVEDSQDRSCEIFIFR